MIECILADLYRIEIPLPDSPLKSINSYLIKGEERFLLIDTGMNRQECLDTLLGNLDELDVDLNRTDLLLTHFHIDHSGLVGELATENSKIYCSAVDASILTSIMYNQKKRLDEHAGFYIANGFPEQKFKGLFAKNPGYSFSRLTWGLNVRSWERFPSMQKWFALGETIAHLKFLAADNRAVETTDADRILYAVTSHV